MTYAPLYVVGQYVDPSIGAPPFRTTPAWQDPFPPDHFMNTPIGSGLTYVSTGDARHTTLVGLVSNLNYNNWTDPIYLSDSADPVTTVEHRDFLPAGWQTTSNTSTLTASGAGWLHKRYTGVRIPTSARWESSSNADPTKWASDRKVHVVQGTDTTLVTQTYNEAGTLLSTVSKFYPAGTLAIEMHKFQRTTTANLVYTTNLSRSDIVNEYGLTEGAIASGISPMAGYVRTWEIAAIAAGDRYAIKHALKVGLANGNLKAGPVWPSRTEDIPNTSYSGTIPYGTHIVLPPSVNIETLSGGTLNNYQKAFLYALQRFGAYVLIRAGSTGVMSFGAEPRIPQLTSTQVTQIKTAINLVIPSLRISANSSSVGTLRADRQPVDSSLIAGGGTRITAGLGLLNFDDTTGLKLPLDPDLY